MLTQAPRGTRDILPQESGAWQRMEAIMREVAALHGLREIRTPVFEHTELFLRSVGDTTDIVQKEVYTFMDKGDRSLTLKPEGTAGVVRAVVEHGLYNEALPLGMYYITSPIFRYENPQSGRLREHHQFGVEIFGAPKATQDAQVISLAYELIRRLGLAHIALHINSIGCPVCRPSYQQALRAHFAPNLASMCGDCKDRFERNPLRLLDCKQAPCQPFKAGAPTMLERLCEDCSSHFAELTASLDAIGLAYTVDTGIVRGLDYYSKTVFEFIAQVDGKPLTLCAGGRYDGLVEQVGGPALGGIGFGMGMERMLSALKADDVDMTPTPAPLYQVLVLCMGDEARAQAFILACELRAAGLSAYSDHIGRSLKAQFKYAGKMQAPYCAIIAPDELAAGVVKLRDMTTGEESTIPRQDIVATIAKQIGK